MRITIILCTYNRGPLLAAALESVAASTLPESVEWEVLVMDNNSTDQTRVVVEDFRRRYPGRFRYLFEPRQGKSYALNTAITAAKGDVLAFLDDDVIVETSWLRNLTLPFESGEWAGTGGRILPQWSCSTPHWLPEKGWHVAGPLALFDMNASSGPLHEPPFGTNMAFRKDMFEKYGNFRTDLGRCGRGLISNEDTEFGRRLLAGGEALRYQPSAVVYHPVTQARVTKRYYLRWWFDKARTDVRELGVPNDAHWLICGVPAVNFRRLLRWTVQWMVTMNPRLRFEQKLKVWVNMGLIVECHRLSSRAKRRDAKPQTQTWRQRIWNVLE